MCILENRMVYPFPYDCELPAKRAAAFIRDIHPKLLAVYDREVLGDRYDIGRECAHLLHSKQEFNQTQQNIVDALDNGMAPEGIGTALLMGAREPERHDVRLYAARRFLLDMLNGQAVTYLTAGLSNAHRETAEQLVICSYRILTEMVECAAALNTRKKNTSRAE